MADDIIAASKPFRIKVLALLLYSDWMLRYGAVLKPEYFPSDDEREVVEWLNWYYGEYKDVPSDVDIEDGIGSNALVEEAIAVTNDNLQYAADRALEFAKVQAMKLAILTSVEDIQDGQLGNIRGRVEEALKVGVDRSDLGLELVDDMDDWVYEDIHSIRHPTGWMAIDKLLQGGLANGEYGLLMAPTGVGKTTGLINIGYAMAGLIGATNVLHVSLEMRKQKILRRYGIRVAGAVLNRGVSEKKFVATLKKKARMSLRAKLRVVDSVRTIDGIRTLIDNLGAYGFDVGALIVDYADLMAASRKGKERRFELADISRELRELGQEYDMPVWSATQAGRQALYKEVITVSDIAEAIEKANIADFVLAICQTRDEQRLGHGRLFVAKARDAASGLTVPIKMNLKLQTITQRGRLSV